MLPARAGAPEENAGREAPAGRAKVAAAGGRRSASALRLAGICPRSASYQRSRVCELSGLLLRLKRNRRAAALQVKFIKLIVKVELGKEQQHGSGVDADTKQEESCQHHQWSGDDQK